MSLVLLLSSCYEMRVEVHKLPSNTPENDDIYITGEFNSWDPGDSEYVLKKKNDSVFYVDLPRGVGEMEYKFTRGDWTTVEKDNCGYETDNHFLKYDKDSQVEITAILSWADLDPVDCDQITIVLKELPENTPQDAYLSFAGSINGWEAAEKDYEFHIDENSGLPVLTLFRPGDLEEVEFKITRGSLSRSEADELGREIRPRTIRFGEADTVFLEVKSWQDLEKEHENMITLIVESIPDITPSDEQIFFVGEINDWYPHDGKLRLEKNSKGRYFINLPKSANNKEYKFTRGNWRTVETDKYGYEINNRTLRREKSSDTISVSIRNWKDLSEEDRGSIRIRLQSVPDNTPEDEDIYIAGNFNNWNPGSNAWKLIKDTDGIYYVDIPRDGNMLEFKFTRGDWSTVEVDEFGDDIPNRTYRYGEIKSLDLEILNWNDLY